MQLSACDPGHRCAAHESRISSAPRWHFLYFFPPPHQHGSFRPSFSSARTGMPGSWCCHRRTRPACSARSPSPPRTSPPPSASASRRRPEDAKDHPTAPETSDGPSPGRRSRTRSRSRASRSTGGSDPTRHIRGDRRGHPSQIGRGLYSVDCAREGWQSVRDALKLRLGGRQVNGLRWLRSRRRR